jgi:phage I-like protein
MPKRSKPTVTQPFGIAACALAVTRGSELQLLPAGGFHARDGRPHDAPGWHVDAATAKRLIDAAAARGTPYVIDYEHQTLLAKDNGKPAPAAGWFHRLEWREGVGLFAVDVEWTDGAAAMIEKKEYRFISPVIGYDKATGAVTSLYMAAITNNPAIDGMSEVLLTAAALHFTLSPPTPLTEDTAMEELLEQLRWLLNLPVGTPAEGIVSHLQTLIDQLKAGDPEATAAASFDLVSYLATQRQTLASLSTATPDPAKYVPIGAMVALQGQLAALTTNQSTSRVDEVVSAALASGKLLPAQEEWARSYGAQDIAGLTAYLEAAQPIAALSGLQSHRTNVVQPNQPHVAALTASQKDMCRMMGVSEADYLKTLQELAGAVSAG